MRIIAGAYKGRKLKTITGNGYRPAMSKVRESLFSLLEARGVVWQDCQILDLFAGSGSLAFEALSRGAQKAYFVEKDPKAAACISENVRSLGLNDKCHVITEDVLQYVGRRPPEPFSMVFIDPPYAQNFLALSLNKLLRRQWLSEDAFIVAEVEKHLKVNTEGFEGLELELDRHYGQTRILVWTVSQE